jgi:putative transposase
MSFNSSIHHRRSIRLTDYDYRTNGAYFITLVTVGRTCLFGSIENGCMTLSTMGQIVAETWDWMGQQYPYLQLDEWIIMPNHFHAILWIQAAPTILPADQAPIKVKPLGSLMGAFKTVSTRQINRLRANPTAPLWQRNYYEHIIRDQHGLETIRTYIFQNPGQWDIDQENPRIAGN